MQHKIHPLDSSLAGLQVPDIPLKELDLVAERLQVLALAGQEIVQDSNPVSSADKLFGEMRSDKTGASRDEISFHVVP
jgi:hypothetical protein